MSTDVELLNKLKEILTSAESQEVKLDTLHTDLVNVFNELGGVSTKYNYDVTRDANNRITQIVIKDASGATLKTIDFARDANGYIEGQPAITET